MAETTPPSVVPMSMLDTDLYKLTMQQAVLHHFPDAQATYRFTHRDKDVPFTRECIDAYRAAISEFSALAITKEELQWLKKSCPYFKPSYLEHLETYRFKPEQVSVRFTPTSEDGKWGNVEIEATGPWHETIMWEVPLMACLSELYFKMVDTDWISDGQHEIASEKARSLLKADCAFSEFGTRRRRSYYTQDVVVQALIATSAAMPGQGKVSGTSNVHLAMKHGIAPVGTIAHEWFMAVGSLKGYEHANEIALTLWEEVYPNVLLVALTDTFSTGAFFKDFVADPERAKRWTGLRQDSGDPFEFAPKAKAMYESVGIAPHEKSIIFSDALNLDKALRLKQQCDKIGFKVAFGIGTYLTNDFKKASTGGNDKSKALNMVIKISSVDGKPCVKISDDLTKNTGDSAEVRKVKEIFDLPQ